MRFKLNDVIRYKFQRTLYLIIDIFERNQSIYLNKKSYGIYTIKNIDTGECYNVENYYLDQDTYDLVKEPNDIMKNLL